MKQLLRVLLVMTLVLTMVAPAFATNFVDSISVKPPVGLLPLGTCEHGNTVYGWILDENGNKVDCLCGKDIVVTPLHVFEDGEHDARLPQSVVDLIFAVYEDLHSGDTDLADIHGLVATMKEELGKYAEAHHLSIYDLFDVSIIDRKTGELYEVPEGHSLMVKFDVQIDVDLFVEVMSYAVDHWQLAQHEENQGDGLLVILNHLCPVAILVQSDDIPTDDEPGTEPGGDDQEGEEPSGSGEDDGEDDGEGGKGDTPKTGDESNPVLWGGLCAAALAGLLGALKARKRA